MIHYNFVTLTVFVNLTVGLLVLPRLRKGKKCSLRNMFHIRQSDSKHLVQLVHFSCTKIESTRTILRVHHDM